MRLVKIKKGFSLVEIIVVILILSILVSISVVSYQSTINRAKITDVKSNMRMLQMAVEIFASDNGGKYPNSLVELKTTATEKGYWKSTENPFTNIKDDIVDLNLQSTLSAGQIGYKAGNEQPVMTLGKLDFVLKYAALSTATDTTTSSDITSYFIIGGDQNGKPIMDTNGAMLVFTNGNFAVSKTQSTTPTNDNATNNSSSSSDNSSSSNNDTSSNGSTPSSNDNTSNTPNSNNDNNSDNENKNDNSNKDNNSNKNNNGNNNSNKDNSPNQNSQDKGDNRYDKSSNSNK